MFNTQDDVVHESTHNMTQDDVKILSHGKAINWKIYARQTRIEMKKLGAGWRMMQKSILINYLMNDERIG